MSLESKDWVAIIAIVIPQLVLVILAIINKRKLNSVEENVNGKMSRLLEKTEEAATAKGKEEGRVEGKETEKADQAEKK